MAHVSSTRERVVGEEIERIEGGLTEVPLYGEVGFVLYGFSSSSFFFAGERIGAMIVISCTVFLCGGVC